MFKQCLCAVAILLLTAGSAWANIWEEAKEGDVQTVQKEIESGVDVNARDKNSPDSWTPLHGAAKHNQVEMVQFLLANGADVNAKDSKNKTPLLVQQTNCISNT